MLCRSSANALLIKGAEVSERYLLTSNLFELFHNAGISSAC
jgi:hypothetical protein